ncbi:MAG: hypothetical protein OXR84_01735 [Magnetovibrio sp.]|nr:hypothetical protein [Magnetovibrio sp.]
MFQRRDHNHPHPEPVEGWAGDGRLPLSVITGLDPVIHDFGPSRPAPREVVDARIKSGHDGGAGNVARIFLTASHKIHD